MAKKKEKDNGPCNHEGKGRYETTLTDAAGKVKEIDTHCAKCDQIVDRKRP
jgi:hypothetical protein